MLLAIWETSPVAARGKIMEAKIKVKVEEDKALISRKVMAASRAAINFTSSVAV